MIVKSAQAAITAERMMVSLDFLRRMAFIRPLRTGNLAPMVISLLPTPSKMRRCSVKLVATAVAVPMTSSSALLVLFSVVRSRRRLPPPCTCTPRRASPSPDSSSVRSRAAPRDTPSRRNSCVNSWCMSRWRARVWERESPPVTALPIASLTSDSRCSRSSSSAVFEAASCSWPRPGSPRLEYPLSYPEHSLAYAASLMSISPSSFLASLRRSSHTRDCAGFFAGEATLLLRA
mmetsp:Transcript_27733/g.71373  ORF Transcript_27733/g.71373 Transcript_27733/m.71373 type:complete len:233 (+) Transcript_27733:169-867(+)